MELGGRQPKLMYALVGALIALLLGLAALQYHWLGEVSRGERERMQSNLNASVKQFAQDFDRELTRVFLAFQTDIRADTEPADIYAARYRNWRENAPNPRLARDVYLLEQKDVGKGWQLACYQENITFTPCVWPENLAALRQRVENPPEFHDEVRRVINKNGKTEMINLVGMLPMQHAMADPDIPALIVPADNPLGHEPGLPPQSFDHSSKYFVIVLDVDYLKREFIPQLAQKYDLSGPASAYRLTVANARDDAKIVYQSNADNTTGAGDAAANFFSIRLEEFDNLLVKPANGQNAPMLKNAQRVTINIFQNKTELKSAEVAPAFAAKLGGNPGWRAVAQHRSGSLDAAVAQIRRRNLALSAAILALLGVSLALIVRASQRAQLLAARQMEFVAGVSHELRTPLAVICSAAENLADGVVERREQTQRYGALIRDEGRRLGGMVEQVLEFAGAQSGRQTYDLRPVAAHEVVHDALTLYREQLAEQDWRVENNLPEDLPLIQADAPALTRAMQNLIGNALKYGDAGRFLRLSAHSQGDFVALTVADKGRGIPADELRHIFEPFQRGREAVAEQIHGNGLGLSLVRHIANAHGGRVEVKSEKNKGSAFTIYVPLAEQVSTQSGSDWVGLTSL